MNTRPSASETTDPLQAERKRLARQLFECSPVDLATLLDHGHWGAGLPRPTPDELLTPLANGLKRFRLSCW
ncbi:MAG: hypothetical protein H7834_01155 [Magnetococcus sp. YQC-9]